MAMNHLSGNVIKGLSATHGALPTFNEEVVIPMSQIMSSFRVIDKSQGRYISPVGKRPPIPSKSFCFVCVKNLTRTKGSTPKQKITEVDFLCLLKDILELSASRSRNYLSKMTEPENWMGLCLGCLEVIRQVANLREQISQMEMELRKCQRQILKKMKGTELSSNLEVPLITTSKEGEQGLTAVENILTFVSNRKYYSVFPTQVEARNDLDNMRGSRSSMTHPKNVRKQGPGPKAAAANLSLLTAKIRIKEPSSYDADEIPIPDVNDVKSVTGDSSMDPLSIEYDVVDLSDDFEQKPEEIQIDRDSPAVQCSSFASSPPPTRLLFCGLCNDDQSFINETQLKRHTNKVHGSRNKAQSETGAKSSKIIKRKRKSSTSLEEGVGVVDELIISKSAEVPDATIANEARTAEEDSDSDSSEMESEVSEGHPKEDLGAKMWAGYNCPICPGVRDYKISRFIQHLAIHQRRPYQCSICSKLFPADEDLRDLHWKEAHSTSVNSSESFINTGVDPGEIWRCDGCFTGFVSEDTRNDHETTCSFYKNKPSPPIPTTPTPCQTCGKVFRSITEWRLHRVLHHPDVERMSCLFCDKYFGEQTIEGIELRRDDKLIIHTKKEHKQEGRIYERNWTYDECEECGLVSYSRSDHQGHFMKTHGTLKGGHFYFCSICRRGFGRKGCLQTHITDCHFKRDSLFCDVCGMEFNQQKKMATLVEHKLRKHEVVTEGRKLWSCPVEDCQFKTSIKKVLTGHSQSKHGAPRRYTCKHCGKGFMSIDSLRPHEELHVNKQTKPFQCDLCGNSFALQKYLQIHKRLTHESRRFPSVVRRGRPKGSIGW